MNSAKAFVKQDVARKAQPYDFRRPDRIAKEQLRAIQLLHDNFARSLGSSLSAYLRAYAVVNLISVEQLSFIEFLQCLPSPTCMISLGMSQFDNNALMEMSPSVVFPIIEMLLGGTGGSAVKIDREVTEIERSILDGVIRMILKDLREAWKQVTQIDFTLDGFETEPQLMQILAPTEAVVAISIDVRIGEASGLLNIAIPSITLKMLGQKFDQQWSTRRTEATESQQEKVLQIIENAEVQIDARLRGPTLSVANLLKLKDGDILAFDYPVERPLDILIGGRPKFRGQVVVSRKKRSMVLEEIARPPAIATAAS
jgi:flagellar motor switch protein FliM